ncbi:MAG: branched-chain amino acid ABC transporter permease [Acidimicrobiales bacterium]
MIALAGLVLASIGSKVGVPLAGGIVNGAVYGLVALGIVLVYRSNRIFNFAQAEFGSVAAFFALAFLNGLGPFPKLPYPLAILGGLVAGTLTGLLTERFVIRPLFRAPRATLLVATAGTALFLISVEAVVLGVQNIHVFRAIAPNTHFALFGPVGGSQAFTFGFTEIDILIGIVVLAVAGAWFFRTKWGYAVLAVSEDPVAASIVGISTKRISALTWGIAGLIGAVAGVLYAPVKGALTPGFMTGIGEVGPLVFGLVAAVIGGMTSLPGAFLGGILVGVIGSFAGTYIPSSVPGGEQVTLAFVLLVVLLVRPTGILGSET